MILAYSQYIETNFDRWTDDGGRRPDNPELFFRKRGYCPFCKREVPPVFDKGYGRGIFNQEASGSVMVWSCDSCGWWELLDDSFMELTEEMQSHQKIRHAILSRYDPSDVQLPLAALRRTLLKTPSIIHEIHPRKLEELVQSVFSDYYDCQVEHCGRSNDGGVDLVLVLSDHPALVQIKRREQPKPSEAVASVREFLGAMVLKQSQHGIFVTTANEFSAQARHAASQAVTIGAVKEFNLVNLQRFFDMLDLVKSKDSAAEWRKHIPDHGTLWHA